MSDEIVIERRFRGPPESANGGYACGRLAAFLPDAPSVEVTLRAPPPLEAPLRVRRAGEAIALADGDALIAEARPAAAPEPAIPDPVGLVAAEAARRDSPLHRHHPFEECFVCGPKREPGDGLKVTCGPVAGRERELVAAPFETERLTPDLRGEVPDELVWAALDCPTGLAGMLLPDFGLSVLGRLTRGRIAPVPAGPTYVAIGWPLERDGRKLHAAAALLDEEGEPLAVSAATWIELRGGGRGYG